MAAILLHDIGHGPFHMLWNIPSAMVFIMKKYPNYSFPISTSFTIISLKWLSTFLIINTRKNFCTNWFLRHLDMDRIDYLKRDSFFTGVSEGIINYERLINMLNVVDDDLVIQAKGIYSAEKFITARRLMYWQVYLHKTVLAAEYTLMRILKRAKDLSREGRELFSTPALAYFLKNDIDANIFKTKEEALINFAKLDDFDVLTSLKVWVNDDDKVFQRLAKALSTAGYSKLKCKKKTFSDDYIQKLKKKQKRNLI